LEGAVAVPEQDSDDAAATVLAVAKRVISHYQIWLAIAVYVRDGHSIGLIAARLIGNGGLEKRVLLRVRGRTLRLAMRLMNSGARKICRFRGDCRSLPPR
jgi:hypothetical protein